MKVLENKDLKNIIPKNGDVIFTANYRIDVIKNEKDGSFSKSIITNRNNFKEISYFFGNVPVFIMNFLNK